MEFWEEIKLENLLYSSLDIKYNIETVDSERIHSLAWEFTESHEERNNVRTGG